VFTLKLPATVNICIAVTVKLTTTVNTCIAVTVKLTAAVNTCIAVTVKLTTTVNTCIAVTVKLTATLNTCMVESKQTEERFPFSTDLCVKHVVCLLPPDRTRGSSNLPFNAYRGASAGE
jgi:hypothetical protein